MIQANELRFYHQPFRLNKHSSWVYDRDNNFVFQFERKHDKNGNDIPSVMMLENRVIDSLNSTEHKPIWSLSLSIDEEDNGVILNHGLPLITIRGWGNLTGIGAHNFPAEKAAKIQDDFRDWIIYKLTLTRI